MVNLQLSDVVFSRLKRLLQTLQSDETKPIAKQLIQELDQFMQDGSPTPSTSDRGVISHAELLRLSKTCLQVSAPQDVHLYTLSSLLAGSSVHLPKKPTPVRSAELEATLARIRLQQEREEYAAMLATRPSGKKGNASSFSLGPAAGTQSSISSSTKASIEEAAEWLEVRRQLSALANILLSGIAVSVATWWASGIYMDLGLKVILSSALGIGIMVVEAILYARHYQYMQDKERKRKEGWKGKMTIVEGEEQEEIWKRMERLRNQSEGEVTTTKG